MQGRYFSKVRVNVERIYIDRKSFVDKCENSDSISAS